MNSLGVIVARRASTRLPDKVLKSLLGTPLIGFATRAAAASRLDRVIVSTEDEEIAEVAQFYGAEFCFRRPIELAADYAEDHEIILHALDWAEQDAGQTYDVVVLIQSTTPFMLASHIDNCLDVLAASDANCCFTARAVREMPHWMFVARSDGSAETLLSGHLEGSRQHTQHLLPAFLPTGAAFAIRTEALRDQQHIYATPLRMSEMEESRSIDIDEPIDLVMAEAIGAHYGFSVTPATRKIDA
jgi:CMP-N,N'-diacetyllegionaminic acid synthase